MKKIFMFLMLLVGISGCLMESKDEPEFILILNESLEDFTIKQPVSVHKRSSNSNFELLYQQDLINIYNVEPNIKVDTNKLEINRILALLETYAGKLKSEVGIICDMARAVLGKSNTTDWEGMKENYDLIREKIEAVIPGFERYNENVRKIGGFYLPNGAREMKFNTPDRKAQLTINPLNPTRQPETPFILMTVRSHDQFNTSIYGYDDRYRGISNSREVVMMNTDDMKNYNCTAGDLVKLTSIFAGKKRVLEGFQVVPYNIPPGCLSVYFPEGNVLVALDNNSVESHCPASKYIEVFLEKLSDGRDR